MNGHHQNDHPATLPARRRGPAREQLETVVRSSPQHRTWRRPVVLAGASGALVVCTGMAAIAYVKSEPVTNKTDARCYTIASLDNGNDYTTIAQAARPGAPDGRVTDALAVCATLYRQGYLRPGIPGMVPQPNTTITHKVPRLIACTMPDGKAAIFPGRPGTCAKLGLPKALNHGSNTSHTGG